jgi:hypothetical protein
MLAAVMVAYQVPGSEDTVLLQYAGITSASRLLNPVMLLLALVSYLRRREAIGGWLMFFFCTAYIGLLVALLISIPAVVALYPLPTMPPPSYAVVLGAVGLLRVVGYAGVALVSTYLLRCQEWQWVERLRFAIGANVVLNGVCLVFDQIYFPEALLPNVIRWVILCAWLIYFFVSVRVRTVFQTKNWG